MVVNPYRWIKIVNLKDFITEILSFKNTLHKTVVSTGVHPITMHPRSLWLIRVMSLLHVRFGPREKADMTSKPYLWVHTQLSDYNNNDNAKTLQQIKV